MVKHKNWSHVCIKVFAKLGGPTHGPMKCQAIVTLMAAQVVIIFLGRLFAGTFSLCELSFQPGFGCRSHFAHARNHSSAERVDLLCCCVLCPHAAFGIPSRHVRHNMSAVCFQNLMQCRMSLVCDGVVLAHIADNRTRYST